MLCLHIDSQLTTLNQQKKIDPRYIGINRNNASMVQELLSSGFTNEDIINIKRSYNHAKYTHRGQTRDTGERYFEHLREVVRLLLLTGVKNASIIKAAFLHDVVEDTGFYANTSLPYEQWIEIVSQELVFQFGSKTALIIMQLTKIPYEKKLDTSYWSEERKTIEGYLPITKENHDKFYIDRLSKAGVETIIVKMADRLHNLMTMDTSNIIKIQKQVCETEKEYMPIFTKYSDHLVDYPANYRLVVVKMLYRIRLQLMRLHRLIA